MKADELYVKKITFKRLPGINWEKYPFNIPVISNLHTIELRKQVTIIVAENGMGKSTLLEAIAVKYGFNPEGGSKNFNFSTYSSHSELYDYITLTRSHNRARDGYFFRAESYYNVASEIQRLDSEPGGGGRIINSYGGTSLHEMSHGESFFALMKNRLGGNGFYMMDEPESSLSPSKQLAMLVLMNELVQKNSQLIICTHSPIIMGFPGAEIFHINETGLHPVQYEELEHVIVSKYFLNNREKVLSDLGISKYRNT